MSTMKMGERFCISAKNIQSYRWLDVLITVKLIDTMGNNSEHHGIHNWGFSPSFLLSEMKNKYLDSLCNFVASAKKKVKCQPAKNDKSYPCQYNLAKIIS